MRTWLRAAAAHYELLVSEVADYELRRELLRIGAEKSLSRLDELARELRYVPVTTDTWRSAARLWAWRRRAGSATPSGHGLDGDVLIAAQALVENAVVVTPNTRHFAGMVTALDWTDIALDA